LPRSVIERAREVLKRHEQSEHQLSERLTPGANESVSGSANGAPTSNGHRWNHQEMLFTPLDRDVLDKLRTADLDQLKPLDALNLLADLKKQIS
jgi:DNA mismatch repair protein MutS